jgi:hypothetical protein
MLAVNMKKSGAPFGMAHCRATVPFSVVESARDLHESGLGLKTILRLVEQKAGRSVSINTLQDWIYYRTRIYG